MAQCRISSALIMALVALPVALLGLVVGILLPRDRILVAWPDAYRAARDSGTLALLGRGFMLVNVAMLAQQVWYRCTSPGTFRRLCHSIYATAGGKAWQVGPPATATALQGDAAVKEAALADAEEDSSEWPVGKQDLQMFQARALQGENEEEGRWEKFVDKNVPDTLQYVCWRRMTPARKSEYKSVTVIPDASPQEVRTTSSCPRVSPRERLAKCSRRGRSVVIGNAVSDGLTRPLARSALDSCTLQ